MLSVKVKRVAAALGVAAVAVAAQLPGGLAPASAATCRDPGGFDKWLGDVKREAAAQGISQRAIAASLADVSYDPGIISRDRGQRVFKQSFEEFSGRMVNKGRLSQGAAKLRQYASTLARIEKQYGVPGPVVVAIWGLETDFGAVSGKLPVIRSVATLSFDCRRTDFFTPNLFDAMRIVDRGDLTPAEMRGAWAGEMGQTQFMPSNYWRYAVDYDGDGRRDLLHSPNDVLASTANFLAGHGWQRGQPWDEGTANYEAILQWNKAQVYARTIVLYANKLAGAAD
jgi:lytic murein transglycosylase